MAISTQRLTIYLYSAHRTVIFAIAQLSCITKQHDDILWEVQLDFIRFRDEKCLPSNHYSTRRTIGFMHQSVPRSDTPIPAVTHALNIQQDGYGVRCRVNNGITELIFFDPIVKVNGQFTAMSCCLSRCFQKSSVS